MLKYANLFLNKLSSVTSSLFIELTTLLIVQKNIIKLVTFMFSLVHWISYFSSFISSYVCSELKI